MFIKKKQKQPQLSFSHEFNCIFEYIKSAFKYDISDECENVLQEKIEILNYMLEVIKKDLQYDLLTDILYKYPKEPVKIDSFFVPIFVYDEMNNCINICESDKTRKVNFKNDCVVVVPWESSRLINSIINISKEGFEYMSDNHYGYYFEWLDICYMYNGNHSISAGISSNKGSIIAKVCDTAISFPHLFTNGVYWFNSHTNQPFQKVCDFRIAAIYEIAKMKYNLIK